MNPYRERFSVATEALRDAEARALALTKLKEQLQEVRCAMPNGSSDKMQAKWQIEDLSEEIRKIRDEIVGIVRMRKAVMRQFDAYEENPIEEGIADAKQPKASDVKGSRCPAFGRWTEIRENLS